jgi:hypothetical protein
MAGRSLFFWKRGSFGLGVAEFIFFLAGVLVLSGLGGPLLLFREFMDVLLYPETIAWISEDIMDGFKSMARGLGSDDVDDEISAVLTAVSL